MGNARGNPETLVPIPKGKTGNPGGSSKKQRRKLAFRRALESIADSPVPDVWMARLDPELVETLPPDITWAELVMLRAVLVGATSTKAPEILAAANLIMATQEDRPEPPPKLKPPILESTEEQRKAIAEELGIEVTDRVLQ